MLNEGVNQRSGQGSLSLLRPQDQKGDIPGPTLLLLVDAGEEESVIAVQPGRFIQGSWSLLTQQAGSEEGWRDLPAQDPRQE